MKHLSLSAFAACLLLSTGAAFAQNSMSPPANGMSNDGMAKSSMSKDGMSHDAMGKSGMSKDSMGKGGMSHDGMKKDTMGKSDGMSK